VASWEPIPIASGRSETQIIVDGASYHGHTVDGTAVEPGAAPVVTFDQERSGLVGYVGRCVGF